MKVLERLLSWDFFNFFKMPSSTCYVRSNRKSRWMPPQPPEKVVISTGAPQGTVLSLFLFTLYTSDLQYNSESCLIQKYSDDSAAAGRSSDEG